MEVFQIINAPNTSCLARRDVRRARGRVSRWSRRGRFGLHHERRHDDNPNSCSRDARIESLTDAAATVTRPVRGPYVFFEGERREQEPHLVLVGTWTYRRFLNIPTCRLTSTVSSRTRQHRIDSGADESFKAEFRHGWALELTGSITYGNPFTFASRAPRRRRVVRNGFMTTKATSSSWPNGINQRMAMVGTIVRTFHTDGDGGTEPAGVLFDSRKTDEPSQLISCPRERKTLRVTMMLFSVVVHARRSEALSLDDSRSFPLR